MRKDYEVYGRLVDGLRSLLEVCDGERRQQVFSEKLILSESRAISEVLPECLLNIVENRYTWSIGREIKKEEWLFRFLSLVFSVFLMATQYAFDKRCYSRGEVGYVGW